MWAGGGPGGSGDKSGNESHLAADLRNVAALNKVSPVSEAEMGRDARVFVSREGRNLRLSG